MVSIIWEPSYYTKGKEGLIKEEIENDGDELKDWEEGSLGREEMWKKNRVW